MAAKDNVNANQFVHVFRGLYNVDPDEVDYKNLGVHWTTNDSVARQFSRDKGTVIAGKVNTLHLITPYDSDWHEFSEKNVVFGPNSREQEVSVRAGSPIQIKSAYHLIDHPGEDEPTIYNYSANEEYDELSRKIPRRGRA